jgi:hypothetical protein
MHVTRRRLLEVAAAVPAGVALAALGARASQVMLGAASSFRPSADGTSATRCALCGGADHAMLDPGCPAARKVI